MPLFVKFNSLVLLLRLHLLYHTGGEFRVIVSVSEVNCLYGKVNLVNLVVKVE